MTTAECVVTQYAYNGLGQMVTQTSPDTISFTWDALGRMTWRTSGSTTESFTYDEGVNGIGRLTRINDATGQTGVAPISRTVNGLKSSR